MCRTEGQKAAARLEQDEIDNLASYALKSRLRHEELGTRFREHRTAPLEYRTEYHRDRDRILWSKAFKRLQHKTQVFPHYTEDHYRRRLTHSLEVAQIATTLARALKLNEVAAEAIALGHDLGHAPFGHAGEAALNEKLRVLSGGHVRAAGSPVPVYGFDHCAHAIEVVCRIEHDYQGSPYAKHYGLNLTFDVRDGILKHMFDRKPEQAELAGRPFSRIANLVAFSSYAEYGESRGSLEAQCVYFADKVAYLLGDIEDGLRRRIFAYDEIQRDEFIKAIWEAHCRERGRDVEVPKLRRMDDFLAFRRDGLAALILVCIENTTQTLKDEGIETLADVLGAGKRLLWVPSRLHELWTEFHRTRMENRLYIHKDVSACVFKAKKIVRDLFDAYMDKPDLIDHEYRKRCEKSYGAVGVTDACELHLIMVRDYVAGMTDPFATNQHKRLFMSSEQVTFS